MVGALVVESDTFDAYKKPYNIGCTIGRNLTSLGMTIHVHIHTGTKLLWWKIDHKCLNVNMDLK